MSLGHIDNRPLPRPGVLANRIGNQQGDSQKQPPSPVVRMIKGVEVAEDLKQRIDTPDDSKLLRDDEVELYLGRIEEEIKEHPEDLKRVQANKMVALHSLRADEIRNGDLA